MARRPCAASMAFISTASTMPESRRSTPPASGLTVKPLSCRHLTVSHRPQGRKILVLWMSLEGEQSPGQPIFHAASAGGVSAEKKSAHGQPRPCSSNCGSWPAGPFLQATGTEAFLPSIYQTWERSQGVERLWVTRGLRVGGTVPEKSLRVAHTSFWFQPSSSGNLSLEY